MIHGMNPSFLEDTVLRLYLFRHGSTELNQQARYSGHQDVSLSEQGIKQMKQWHRLLLPIPFKKIYTSPLNRAQQSAHYLVGDRSIPIVIDDRLIELDFGEWEGKRFDEVRNMYPEAYEKWRSDPINHGPVGGETLSAVQGRVTQFVKILDQEEGTVGLVSHVTPLKVIVAILMDIPVRQILRFYLAPASVTVLDRHENTWSLRVFNLPAEPGPFLHRLTHETF